MKKEKKGLDAKDLAIIKELRANSRQSIARLAAKLSLPSSTVFFRLMRLEKSIISKYYSVIDFSKLGYFIRLNLAIKAREKKKSTIESFLLENKNINTLLKLRDGYDFYAEAIFRNIKEAYETIDAIEDLGARKIEKHFIAEELKKEGFIALA